MENWFIFPNVVTCNILCVHQISGKCSVTKLCEFIICIHNNGNSDLRIKATHL